ncbi:MAG: hypothetical protein GX160_07710 [Clostridiales bacterium]|nr:hypothetical protein [Clostridiales bacterium]
MARVKKFVRFLDGVALRYIPMFFVLGIANALVLKILFDQKVTNKLTVTLLCFTSLAVSIIWTRLATKTEFSEFSHRLPPYIKKKALSKRAIRVIIFYIVLRGIRSIEESNDAIIVFSKQLLEYSTAISILILIATFVIILLRPPLRRYF